MDPSKQLEFLKQEDNYRSRIEIDSRIGAYINIDGNKYLNFCSNDYLGLSSHEELKKEFIEAVNAFGVGSGASQLISGYQKPLRKLEEQIAEYLGYEKALIFGSGYLANLGIQQAFFNKDTMVYFDKLNHASMYDGLKVSETQYQRYPHLQICSLLKYKEQHKEISKFILSDSVFSMDGDIVEAEKIQKVARTIGARTIIDDAHGFGVIGKTGKGIVEYFARDNLPSLILIAFGKALGTYGAAVCGDSERIDLMIQQSRSLIYSTAIPPAIASATSKSVELLSKESWRREKLNQSIAYFKEITGEAGLNFKASNTPIQILIAGSNANALSIYKKLSEKNILAMAIRPPTVPANTARIRITITALHEKEHLDKLVDTLAEIQQKS